MKRVVLLVLLAACKTHFDQELHKDSQLGAALSTKAEEAGTTNTGTTRRYEPARYPGEPLKDRLTQASRRAKKTGPKSSSSTGTLLATGSEDLTRKWYVDFLHSPFTWIGAAVVLAGAIGVVLKLRKAAL